MSAAHSAGKSMCIVSRAPPPADRPFGGVRRGPVMKIFEYLSRQHKNKRQPGRPPRRRGRPWSPRRVSLVLEPLETRMQLSVISWDGGAGTLNWRDALNWSGDALPGSNDDVVIGAAFAG